MMVSMIVLCQAEDGIRDYKVTGVQTCALPISWQTKLLLDTEPGAARRARCPGAAWSARRVPGTAAAPKIGRASCRERVQISVVAVSLNKNIVIRIPMFIIVVTFLKTYHA